MNTSDNVAAFVGPAEVVLAWTDVKMIWYAMSKAESRTLRTKQMQNLSLPFHRNCLSYGSTSWRARRRLHL